MTGLLAIGFIVGIVLSRAVAHLPQLLPAALSSGPAAQEEAAADQNRGAGSADEQQGLVKLSADDIATAGIEVAAVESGTITRRIIVPSTIRPHADRIDAPLPRSPAQGGDRVPPPSRAILRPGA